MSQSATSIAYLEDQICRTTNLQGHCLGSTTSMVMAKVAGEEYFSSTLQQLGRVMTIREDCVGVIFLAFANGAPDFFSLLVTSSRKAEILLPLSSLLGAGVFLCTVVVGSIAVYSPGVLNRRLVARDALCYWITVSAVLPFLFIHTAHIWIGVLYILLYVIYILLVMYYPHFTTFCCGNANHDESNHVIEATQISYNAINQDVEVDEVPSSQYSFGCCVIESVDLAIDFILDLTIPVLNEDSWVNRNMFIMIIQPGVCLYLLLHSTGLITSWISFAWIATLSIIIGSSIGLILKKLDCLTRPSSAERSVIAFVWLMISFSMCYSWMYLLSGEPITCLSSLGTLMVVPAAFLGLSILAWGNSLGDLLTNTQISRQSLNTAMAGSYAGPIFNILMGLGAAIIRGTIASRPNSYNIKLDQSCVVSLIFLYLILTASIILVLRNSTLRLERSHGYVLWMIYGIYFSIQVFLVCFR